MARQVPGTCSRGFLSKCVQLLFNSGLPSTHERNQSFGSDFFIGLQSFLNVSSYRAAEARDTAQPSRKTKQNPPRRHRRSTTTTSKTLNADALGGFLGCSSAALRFSVSSLLRRHGEIDWIGKAGNPSLEEPNHLKTLRI